MDIRLFSNCDKLAGRGMRIISMKVMSRSLSVADTDSQASVKIELILELDYLRTKTKSN